MADLQAILVRWNQKRLSYMGYLQLIEWIFHGKFSYLVQSSFLPRHTIQTIQSLSCRFIWGNQREVAWANLIMPRQEGGVGLRDF